MAKIVKENAGTDRRKLIEKLPSNSREYGLSDLQAAELIDRYGGRRGDGA